MNTDEFREYSEMAKRIFFFMNKKINRLNSNCVLYIDMYDYITGTYANIRYPNNITIFIGTIIDSWKDEYSILMNRRDYIGTIMSWALAHELHHADQLISMIQYNNNYDYKMSVEGDVERASYNWIDINRADLSSIGGFNVVIEYLDSQNLPDTKNCNYRKASVKEYYQQTIANIIIRDFDLFNKIGVFTNDELVDDIVLVFGNRDYVVIKSFGRYLPENINTFSNLAYKWAGFFDMYSIEVKAEFFTSKEGRKAASIKFDFSNQLIKPMLFKDINAYGGLI